MQFTRGKSLGGGYCRTLYLPGYPGGFGSAPDSALKGGRTDLRLQPQFQDDMGLQTISTSSSFILTYK